MDSKQYSEIIKKRIGLCELLLIQKGVEYHRNGNPHHVFDSIAKRKNLTPLEVLDNLNQKQLQSFYDMIDDINKGKSIPQKTIDEKFTDIINYFLIAETLVVRDAEAELF